MTTNEILTLILSIVALTASVYSYLKSNAIANANLELSIYNTIRASKVSLYEITKQLMIQEPDEKIKYEYAKVLHDSLTEDLVTSYEEACSKYLDNKVDKKRFEKNFKNDILRLVDSDEINKVIDFKKPSTRREYGAILKAYGQWFDKEK